MRLSYALFSAVLLALSAGAAAAQSTAYPGSTVRPAPADPIVGTYSVMVCAPDFDCQGSLAIRFAPDGTVQTTDGHRGGWTVFDTTGRIYSVVMGPDRWSLQLLPGRGLYNPNDLQVVIFQSVRPH